MASENMLPLAALRKKTYEHIANSRDRNPEYARALTLNLLEEQRLRSTMVRLDRQKTAEISKFRLEHRAFLSRAKSATEQLSRESLGESRGIRRPWSEFGTAARVQFQSAEARLVHGGGSRAGTARHSTATGPGFYTHCHHCARRYIRSTVTAGSGREPEEDVYSRSVTPDTCDDAKQLADKDRWARKSNPRFTVTLNLPQKLSRPTSAATDRSAITSLAAKPPRRPATENGPTAAWAGRRRASIGKTKSVSKQGPSLSQFVSNGATRDNVTSLDDSSEKNQDRIPTGFSNGNGNSAPSGQYRNDRQVLNEHESLPLTSPRGRWFWAYRAVVEANRSRQRQEITGDQGTPTSKYVIKPTKGSRKKKRKGQTDTRLKNRNAKYGDKTGREKKMGKSPVNRRYTTSNATKNRAAFYRCL
ncbi:hypothetical protein Bbelb_126470 [Branchiostoma belcheri]|nr:hypothetical protein Bbelb_126470 [Branchiostoma belcheri]